MAGDGGGGFQLPARPEDGGDPESGPPRLRLGGERVGVAGENAVEGN